MRTNNMNVTVAEVIELINKESVLHAKALANKDRCAVYDRENKKCAEIAYRNKKATFSCALQCNRFSTDNIKTASGTVDATYKYHACKNNRNYMTVNDVDSDDMLNFVFEMLDSIINA